MVKIEKSDEIRPCLKMLVYGTSGVGKTVFGSTAPAPLFLDAEGGMLSVSDKNIDRIKTGEFKDVKDVFMFLKNEKHEYKTVVLDSLTEIQKKSMDGILKANDRDMPRINDWGTNIEQTRRMVRNFRDLPLNVIMTALEHAEKEEDDGSIVIQPAVQGKTLPQEVMGFMDIVGYMVAREKKNETDKDSKEKTKAKIEIVRAIRVQPTATVSAKDRSDKLGIWVKPDFNGIYEKVFGKQKPAETAKEKKGGK